MFRIVFTLSGLRKENLMNISCFFQRFMTDPSKISWAENIEHVFRHISSVAMDLRNHWKVSDVKRQAKRTIRIRLKLTSFHRRKCNRNSLTLDVPEAGISGTYIDILPHRNAKTFSLYHFIDDGKKARRMKKNKSGRRQWLTAHRRSVPLFEAGERNVWFR